MNNKVLNITTFTKGDIITRLEPIVYESDGFVETLYIGTKLEFLGIANACLYAKKISQSNTDNIFGLIFGNENTVLKLPLVTWSEGWGYYSEPDFLQINESNSKTQTKPRIDLSRIDNTYYSNLSTLELQSVLNKAKEEENYELANIINKILEGREK